MTSRGAAFVAKRVCQTPQLFRNFPQVFFDLGTTGTRWRRPELTFRLRNGYVVHCPNADGARFPVYEIFGDDAYEVDRLVAGVDPDATVLDVGGQIGGFSLAVARALPQGRVQVYEASPTSAAYIRRNMSANGLDDRVTVHAIALAAEEGEFTLVDTGTASGHNGMTSAAWLMEQGATEVTVPARTLDQAFADAGGSVQIVKMDVEGAEYDIILGSSPESWASVRKVVMEYHPVAGRSLAELVDFFATAGLSVARDDTGERAGLGILWLTRP